VKYEIPNVGDGYYNITVFLVDDSTVTEVMNATDIMSLSSAKVVYTGTAFASDKVTSPPNIDSFTDDWGMIALMTVGGAFGLGLICYGGWRLQRYRPKYLKERHRAESAEKVLADMADEVDVIQGGREYEAVGAANVSANPLHPAYHLKTDANKNEVELMEGPSGVVADQAARQVVRKELAPAQARALKADLDDDEY